MSIESREAKTVDRSRLDRVPKGVAGGEGLPECGSPKRFAKEHGALIIFYCGAWSPFFSNSWSPVHWSTGVMDVLESWSPLKGAEALGL